MNRKEVLGIMSVLKAAYPNFYRGMSGADAEAAVNLWCDMFADDPPELVGAAVKALISTDEKGYPPHIGAVKAKMRQITAPEQNTEAEAWGMVLKAISRGIYNSKQDFESFPPEIQKIVGSPNQIREWAMMDSNTIQSVVASNFQRAYRAKMKQKAEYDALPPEVKRLAASMAKRLQAGLDAALGSGKPMLEV